MYPKEQSVLNTCHRRPDSGEIWLCKRTWLALTHAEGIREFFWMGILDSRSYSSLPAREVPLRWANRLLEGVPDRWVTNPSRRLSGFATNDHRRNLDTKSWVQENFKNVKQERRKGWNLFEKITSYWNIWNNVLFPYISITAHYKLIILAGIGARISCSHCGINQLKYVKNASCPINVLISPRHKMMHTSKFNLKCFHSKIG